MKTLVIDGGTTNLRVFLLDASGEMLSSARAEGGVRHTALDGHNGRLRKLLHDCIEKVLAETGTSVPEIGRCIAYGMITSSMGLLEIPHLAAPASAKALHEGMRRASFPDVAPFEIEFIPGVRNFAGAVDAGNCSGMDMMRGEETESVGLYRLLAPEGEALFVLPGSHNKFVHMGSKGEILGCMTSISGELLDAVTHHTILADAVKGGFCSAETYDAGMAKAGALECLRSGLGRAAFAGRILNTLGHEDAAKIQSWLLGAVLCEDARALRTFVKDAAPVIYVAGKPPLQQAFIDVLDALGLPGAHPVASGITGRMGIAGALAIAGIG